jgi:ribose 5-phosphate isomerase A
MQALVALGLTPTLRRRGLQPFHTDNGNYIADCALPSTFAVHDLAAAIKAVVGVVDHGFFLGLTDTVVVGTTGGIDVRQK